MATTVATLPSPPLPSPRQPASATPALSGPRQAAILLTSVGDENCAELLRRMREDEVHQVTRELSRLSDVTAEERKSVLERFTIAAEGAAFQSGGVDYATSVLIAAFGPERGKSMAERVLKSFGTETPDINSLQKIDPQHLAKVLQREHPQTIALVLSHVGPSHAAKILSVLPEDVRMKAVRRMALLDQVSPEVVNKIAKTLGSRLRSLGESSFESYGGVRAVAEVLNRVDAATSTSILEQITAENQILGQTIQNLMFVFEDLQRLDEKTIRAILGKVDQKVLVTALKGCTPPAKAKFSSAMSTRAAEMLNEDIEALGPVRIRDVQDAQQAIIAIARQLELEGAISLKPSSGDVYVQ